MSMNRRRLLLRHEYDKYIHFEDKEVERICIENWDKDGDGKLSMEEVAAVSSINAYMFKGLDRENGILDLSMFTNLTSVNNSAFRKIYHLYKLVLPPTISTYDSYFYTSTIDNIIIEVIEKQKSLLWGLTFKNLIIKSVNPPIAEMRASYGWHARKESRIFVPDESVENYRKSDSFSDIAEYIHPISEYKGNY